MSTQHISRNTSEMLPCQQKLITVPELADLAHLFTGLSDKSIVIQHLRRALGSMILPCALSYLQACTKGVVLLQGYNTCTKHVDKSHLWLKKRTFQQSQRSYWHLGSYSIPAFSSQPQKEKKEVCALGLSVRLRSKMICCFILFKLQQSYVSWAQQKVIGWYPLH